MFHWSTAAELPGSAKAYASTARAGQIWRSLASLLNDPRCWQSLTLALLLSYGLWALGFDQSLAGVAAILICALMVQWIGSKAAGLQHYDPLSALISGLSLCLLLRADGIWVLATAAVLAIGSKFLIRWNGKHIFNPTNFAIGVMLLSGVAWISPAQWGSRTWLTFLFACLAGLVLSRAKRADVALAFLSTFVGFLFARTLYLGDPWAIPLKQMQSGALLLFAFFMISDPKTTPDRRSIRIAYGILVAAIAAYLQFAEYRPQSLIYALFFTSPLVPLLDCLCPVAPGRRYEWSKPMV
jgi:Na+-transporting NADH:ubiquinone oxidoreductase subunit NqrB